MLKKLLLLLIISVKGNQINPWLYWHNVYRCMHNVPNVTWNNYTEISAKNWIDKLTYMKHSNSYYELPPAGPAGENLAQGYTKIENIVKAWYDEIKCCNSFPGCESSKCTTGHFTAIVWKGLKQIGCSYNNKNKIGICRYRSGNKLSYDTVNMQGSYKLNVFPKVKSIEQCL